MSKFWTSVNVVLLICGVSFKVNHGKMDNGKAVQAILHSCTRNIPEFCDHVLCDLLLCVKELKIPKMFILE